jgi:DNA-binding GntR family transcriptional regulator
MVDDRVDNLYGREPMAAKRSSGLLTGAVARQLVETRLREEIQSGHVVPGQRLVESELSERLGVTRGSARAALDVLCADGIVERIPYVGGRVRSVSIAEAVEILECRMALDGLMAFKAAESGSADDIEQIAANLERMEGAVASGDFFKYSDLIQEHHGFVRQAAGHTIASDTVARLQAQIVRHQFRLSHRPVRADASLNELRLVVRAIVDRDPDRAEAATRAHLKGVIQAVLAESREG